MFICPGGHLSGWGFNRRGYLHGVHAENVPPVIHRDDYTPSCIGIQRGSYFPGNIRVTHIAAYQLTNV